MRYAVILSTLLATTPAWAAETRVWTDAPVPRGSVTDVVAPSERAGRSTGPDNDSPFSALPSGSPATGGQVSSGGTVGTYGTPSVSR